VDFSQCGADFGRVRVKDLFTVDALQDAAIRQGIKITPTGRPFRSFISRVSSSAVSDIMTEMYQSGEVKKLLEA